MTPRFILEICANSVESAIMAQDGGAHRVELCDNMYEGGTTPSSGAIKIARDKLFIDLNVIIRPRAGDFCYSDDEFEIMKEDINFAKKLKIDGIVLGLLYPNGSVDVTRTKLLIELAKPMSVTFHRAFDVCIDPFLALEDIIECGCSRILSSGQKNKAFEGTELIQKLIQKANKRIIIMPGSGIDESNIAEIHSKTGANEFHASLRKKYASKMQFKKDDVYMNGFPQLGEYEISITDPERVKKQLK